MAGGRIRERIRRWWHGGGQENDDGGNAVQTDANAQPAGNAAMIEEQRTNQVFQDRQENTAAEEKTQEAALSRAPLNDLYQRLRASKRGGLHLRSGNSIYYENIMSALGRINTGMSQGFSADLKSNLEMLVNMEALYQELLQACQAYISRSASTRAGQDRMDIVSQIQKLAGHDIVGLSAARSTFLSLPEQEQAQKSWNELIDEARMVHLTVNDLYGGNKTEGGQVSESYKFNAGQAALRDVNGGETPLTDTVFFKPEDEYDMTKSAHEAKIANKILERFPNMSKGEKSLIQKWANGDKKVKLDKLSEEGKFAVDMIRSRVGNGTSMNTLFDDLMNPAKIQGTDGKVNMTKRNVATSRMAAIFGLEHMVAKSETAEIYDKTTGTTVRGNLMEKAEGVEGNKFAENFRKNHDKDTTAFITPTAQRDLMNLQVFDVLCGQVDRHMGNYMVTTEGDDTITGIKAIDNDGAFGTITDVNGGAKHDRRVYDPESGELVVPYMDKALAARILAVSPDVVRYALKGLIADEEIEAAVTRLEMMQKAIASAGEERFLEDDQWNDDTAETLFRADVDTAALDIADMTMQLLWERIPEIMSKKISDRTEEEDKRYSEEYTKAEQIAKRIVKQQIKNKQNYLGSMMKEVMGYGGNDGDFKLGMNKNRQNLHVARKGKA